MPEAHAWGVPVLVVREVSERPEGIWAQALTLVGTGRARIFREIKELLDNADFYGKMAQARSL